MKQGSLRIMSFWVNYKKGFKGFFSLLGDKAEYLGFVSRG